MIFNANYELPIPLRKDDYGAVRIANTRITLDVIVAAYQHGDTPEEIRAGFPTLTLAKIYAVIAYYLNNQEQVDGYLRERDEQAEKTHHEIEAKRPDMFDLRAKVIKRTPSE
jgi:uncharacterized protein (DUF433 family)